MQLDQKKLARQKLCFRNWLDKIKISIVKAGIIQAVTGFGKTFIAIMAILAMNERHPDRTTIVVVPTTKLKDDWVGYWKVVINNGKEDKVWVPGHIEIWKLCGVRVFVVNTYVKYLDWSCDLLILDEAHHYASWDSKFFSTVVSITKYRFGMALSATLSTKQIEFFEKLGWLLADTVDEEEADREGYVAQSVIYNLAIPLSKADKEFNEKINETFKYYFKQFDFEFDLVMACNIGDKERKAIKLKNWSNYSSLTGKEWREFWAKHKGWKGEANHPYSPSNISKYAAQAMNAMTKRRNWAQNSPSKLPVIKELFDRFPKLKTIVFSETGDFADKVAELCPEKALSYHSNLANLAVKGDHHVHVTSKEHQKQLKDEGYKIKGKTVLLREALSAFTDPNSPITIFSTVKKLDEGFDDDKIEFALMAAYNSTQRQDTQRKGRGKRIDYDNLNKRTLIINIYMEGTQEEKWLRNKQAGTRMIRWVKSVSEIHVNKPVILYAPDIEELSPAQTGVSSDTPES